MVDPQVIIYQSTRLVHVIITPFDGKLTYLIDFDIVTGTPIFANISNVFVFSSETQAIEYVKGIIYCNEIMRGTCLLGIGYSQNIGRYPNATLILATKLKPTANIKKCGSMYTIMETVTFNINHQTEDTIYSHYPWKLRHYICPSYDATSPLFDSRTDSSFIWNSSLKSPFEKLGLGFLIPNVLQGNALSHNLDGTDITFICRRSFSKPFPRTFYSNFSSLDIPVNEVEFELIFENEANQYSHVWRLGYPPISEDISDDAYLQQLKKDRNFTQFEYILFHFPDTEFFCEILFKKLLTDHQTPNPSLNIEEFTFPNDSKINIDIINQMKTSLKPTIVFSTDNSHQEVLNRITSTRVSYSLLWYSQQVFETFFSHYFSKTLHSMFIHNVTILSHSIMTDMFNLPPLTDNGSLIFQKGWKPIDCKATELKSMISAIKTPEECSWVARIDGNYLSHMPLKGIGQQQIPKDIFGLVLKNYSFNSTRGVVARLILPMPMIITSLKFKIPSASLEMFPKNVILFGGMTENSLEPISDFLFPFPSPESSKFNLRDLKRFTFSFTIQDEMSMNVMANNELSFNKNLKSVKYIEIRIFGNNETMVLSNISIIGYLIYGNPINYIFPKFSVNRSAFKEALDAFNQSKTKLPYETLMLEKARIENGINEETAHLMERQIKLNPWFCNPSGRCKEIPSSKCALCGKNLKLSSKPYVMSNDFPNLIIDPKLDHCYKYSNDRILNVCPNCQKIADEISAFTYELSSKIISESYPEYASKNVEQNFPFIFKDDQTIEEKLNDFYVLSPKGKELENGNDTGSNAPVIFDNEMLTLFCARNDMEPSKIMIKHIGKLLLSLPEIHNFSVEKIIDAEGNSITSILIPFKVTLSQLSIVLNGKVCKIDVYGTQVQSNWCKTMPYEFGTMLFPCLSKGKLQWNESYRCQELVFENLTNIPVIGFNILISDQVFDNKLGYLSQINQDKKKSMIFENERSQIQTLSRKLEISMTKNNEEVFWKTIQIPVIIGPMTSDLNVLFLINSNVKYDRICVYYVDPLQMVKPLSISFQTQ